MNLSPGSVFAGHRIESVAGRGGMGVVYKATHIALEIPVALKVIAPEMASDEAFRERFKRESRLAASIDHPNVISVRHAGEEDGDLYITMRFVEGTDLRAKIEALGRIDLATSVEVIGQVAAGLDAAHARDLIHRDVKPANVLIEEGASQSKAYLTDFGLTRKAASGSGLTRTGQWVGTLHYVAPEQIHGTTLDARADIYALGAVSYHCLAGEPPFNHDSDAALIYAHLSEPPPRLTERLTGLPPGVADAVERAMAKDPQDRFSSAGEFAAALKQGAEGATVPGPRNVGTTKLSPRGPAEPEIPDGESPLLARTKLEGPRAAARSRATSSPSTRSGPTAADPPSRGLDPAGRRRAALIGVAALVAVAVAAVVLLGGDGDAGETEDAGSGRSGSGSQEAGEAFVDPPSIPIAGWPLGVVVEKFQLVVATRRGMELQTLNKSTRKPISRTPLPGRGEDVAVQGGSVYVTLPMNDAVARLPLDGGGPVVTIPVGNQPRGIVSDGRSLMVANLVSGTVSTIDSDGGVSTVPLTAGAEPQDVAFSAGALWVSDRTGNVIRVRSGAAPESFAVGRKPRGIVVVGRDVWVANTDDGTVTQLGTDGTVKDVIDVGGMPRGVAAGFSRIWVANGEGYVSTIDIEGGTVQRIPVGGAPEEVTVGSQLVWTTTGKGDSLVAIDPGNSSTP